MKSLLTPPINYEQLETWKDVIEFHKDFDYVGSYSCNHTYKVVEIPMTKFDRRREGRVICTKCGAQKTVDLDKYRSNKIRY